MESYSQREGLDGPQALVSPFVMSAAPVMFGLAPVALVTALLTQGTPLQGHAVGMLSVGALGMCAWYRLVGALRKSYVSWHAAKLLPPSQE